MKIVFGASIRWICSTAWWEAICPGLVEAGSGRRVTPVSAASLVLRGSAAASGSRSARPPRNSDADATIACVGE